METKFNKRSSSNPQYYYMYGTHAVLAALNNKKREIKKIYCSKKQFDNFKDKFANFNVEIVDNEFFKKKFPGDASHQNIAIYCKTIFKYNIEELNFNKTKDKIAILDQISDPQNIGAIIRSAAAFGITKLILTKDNAPDENASIAKTACGCLELIEIAKVTNLNNALSHLKKIGFWIFGLDARGNDPMSQLANFEKIAIIIGSEHSGMRNLTAKACDFLVNIPISQDVESLNASNAASIIFFMTNMN